MQYRYLMLDRERARELYDAGCSDTEIGRQTGVTQQSVGAWRTAEGLPPIRRAKGRSLKPVIAPLMDKGLSKHEIVARTGIDLHAVEITMWAIRNAETIKRHKAAYRARLMADVAASRRALMARD